MIFKVSDFLLFCNLRVVLIPPHEWEWSWNRSAQLGFSFFSIMEINSHANDQVSCSYQIWKDQNVFLSCRRRERRIIDHITLNCVCHRTQRVNFSIQAIFIIVYSIACRFLVSLEYILSFRWLASDRKMVRCAKLRADLLIICSGDN